MSVYVDTLFDYGWMYGDGCHLTADSIQELQSFSLSIGLKPKWIRTAESGIQYFNITANKRKIAIAKGAIEVPFKLGVGWKPIIENTPKTKETKTISFRPFRRVGDKLVITSYMGWRKIYTANYEGATVKLLPFPEIKKGETVYSFGNPNGLYGFWHPTKFEPLFWPVHAKIKYVEFYGGNAADVMYESGVVMPYIGDEINEGMKDDEVYSMFDCSGCPCFSHKTAVYVSENYPDKIHLFEPLTADIVYKYFEKMRDILEKIKWEYSTPNA